MFVRHLAAIARRLRTDDRGATAIEYGLIIALVALGMLAGLKGLADANAGLWGSNANKIIAASR